MSTLLTIYSQSAYRRILLPPLTDTDYSILLSENLYDLPESIELKLEASGGVWCFPPSDAYELKYLNNSDSCLRVPLADISAAQNKLKLMINGLHVVSIDVRVEDNCFPSFTLYDIRNQYTPITVGRDPDNLIRYSYQETKLVSGRHAVLSRSNDCWALQDTSTNGSFINNCRVQGSQQLQFGDCIDIYGLRIVYLGKYIGVNVGDSGAVISDVLGGPVSVNTPPLRKTNQKDLTTVFHRSPRRIAKIDTDTFKIDEPPAPKDEVRPMSILSIIGSAIGMAVPMLIGSLFMVFASKFSGISRGLFMYMGLVTAVSSAIIGMIRMIRGVRSSRQQYENYETQRNERYGAYLAEQEKRIRESYDKNAYALRDRYISAEECCGYDAGTPLLWSRNVGQEDFLVQRLGLGSIPAQFDIVVPEMKFSMTDNSLLEIPSNIKESYSVLRDVPICIDLLENKLVGVIGGKRLSGGIQVMQDLIAQIAANNSYTDVKIAVVYEDAASGLSRQWSFVTSLPHVWNKTKTFRYAATNKEEASEVFYELNKVFRQRAEENDQSELQKQNNIMRPYYCLFIIGPELLDGEQISHFVLNPEPAYGLTTIILAERYEQLPNECGYIIENDESFSGMYHVSDDYEDRITIDFDRASSEDLRRLTGSIANVVVTETESGGDIPESLTFFEMYGIRRLEELNVLSRWKKNRTYESMKALIGVMAGGVPCYLDIHEKYHGPHGLVAGTTGSGKSETLQTYILSMAINFSPDDIAFFIIDYKGGGMANLFADLPHMIGQISNLSGNQVNRALISIQSEIDRRETLFNEYGVKDIREYTKLYKNHETAVPLPILIIIIDEFAEMKAEQPEFIQKIVSVARVGRSLGIRLIMSTQKPSGSVSDEIWANSRFKLCLRVQSKQDSMDMLHKPDAAFLVQAGRAILQVDYEDTLFQSGYSGAIYNDGDEDAGTDIARLLDVDGRAAIEGSHAHILRQRQKKEQWIGNLLGTIQSMCGEDALIFQSQGRDERMGLIAAVYKSLRRQGIEYPETDRNTDNLLTLLEQIEIYGYDRSAIIEAETRFTSAKEKLPQLPERTQLEAVVAYVNDTAKANGYNHDFSLFLPLLPAALYLASLPENEFSCAAPYAFEHGIWPGHTGKWNIRAGIGLYDDPERQRQDTFVIDFSEAGSLLVYGAPATGKSTMLQTLMYCLVNRYSPAEVNIYAMEFSARKFSSFESMPHVGGIIRDTDGPERIDKLFTMLSRMLGERKQRLGTTTFEQYVEVHGREALPAVFLFIDNFAALVNKTGDRYSGLIGQFLKEGISNGMFLVVSAIGTGSSEISNSLAQNFRSAVCLELNNQYDYSTYMKVSRVGIRPEVGVKGRAIGRVGDRILEFQTAMPLEKANEIETGNAIAALAEEMRAAWIGTAARSIPEIPEKPLWSDFVRLDETRQMFASDRYLPVGYDAKQAEPYGIDLANTYSFILSGEKQKGKSNALKALIMSASAKGGRVIILDFQQQLTQIAAEAGARQITTEKEWGAFLSALLKDVVLPRNQKKMSIKDTGADNMEIFEGMSSFEKIYIFIDDLAGFIDRIIHTQANDEEARRTRANMEMIMDRGALHNIFWFSTLTREAAQPLAGVELYKLFVRDRKGMHFGGEAGTTAIAGMSFDHFNRRSADAARPAGIGMLSAANDTDVKEVVIPLVRIQRSVEEMG